MRSRKWLRFAAYGAASFLALLALVLALANTGAGRNFIAATIESAASSENLKIKIEGLDGTLPSWPRASRLVVADAAGPWLVLHNVRAAWSPFSLLGGEIVADEVTVERLEWLRQPSAGTGDSGGGNSIPALSIGRLAVREAAISKDVAGVAARFAIVGSVNLLNPAHEAMVVLTAAELHNGSARLIAEFRFVRAQSLLSANIDIQDRAGGPLAALAGLPPDAPVSVTLVSTGDLDEWRAALRAHGGGELKADGTATVRRDGDWHRLILRFDGQLGTIGPRPWRTFLAGKTQLAIDAALSQQGAIKLNTLRLDSPALTLNGSGVFDPAGRRAEGLATLNVLEGKRWLPLLGDASNWRDLKATAHLERGWPTPTLKISAHLSDLDLNFAKSSKFALSANVIPDRSWHAPGLRLAVSSDGKATGVSYEKEILQNQIGHDLTFKFQTVVQRFESLSNIEIEARQAGVAATFFGDADPRSVKGEIAIDAVDPSHSQVTSDKLTLRAQLAANRETSAWEMRGSGSTANIKTGNASIDGLLEGKSRLEFSLNADSPDLVRISKVSLSGAHMSAQAQGKLVSGMLQLQSELTVPDLSVAGADFGGRLKAKILLKGPPDAPRISGRASLVQGKLLGHKSQSLGLELTEATMTGLSRVTITGDLAGKPMAMNANVGWNDAAIVHIERGQVAYGSLRLSADLELNRAGLLDGALTLEAGALDDIAPLIELDIAGEAVGRLVFTATGPSQDVGVEFASPRLRVETAQLADATISGFARDIFGAAALDLRARSARADFEGFTLMGLDATAKGNLAQVDLTATAKREDTELAVRGRLTSGQKTARIRVAALSLARAGKHARLSEPIELTVAEGKVAFPRARFNAGGGSLSAQGSVGDALNLTLDAKRLPLWIAEFVTSSIPASGTITGLVKLHGPPSERQSEFNLRVNDLKPHDARDAVRNLTLTAKGTTNRQGLIFQAELSDQSGTTLRASGRAPFDQTGALAVDMQGNADLAFVNTYISATGDRARGRLSVSAKVTGTIAAPRVSGSAGVTGGYFRSARAGLELREITAQFSGSEQRVVLTSLSAKAPNGGTLNGRGDIRLDRAGGFPIDLTLTASNAQLVASELTTVTTGLDVRVDGALLRNPTIRGVANISTWEIRVPEKLARPLTPIAVSHRNAPKYIIAEPDMQTSLSDQAIPIELAVEVSAPRRVFVRGQGIDAEFGGKVKVSGTTNDPAINGRFDLRRGAMNLLGERVSLSRGSVIFSGSVVPLLDIAGTVRKSDITATITASGKANDPVLTLTSTPELPQGEILSRILFSKGTQQLSVFEAAQLAQAVAKWSGLAAGPDILDRLREVLGIDALSTITDETGATSVSAGSYVGSGVFVGVKQGAADASGGATVEADLTDEIKLRGEASANGDTRVGIAAEWEY